MCKHLAPKNDIHIRFAASMSAKPAKAKPAARGSARGGRGSRGGGVGASGRPKRTVDDVDAATDQEYVDAPSAPKKKRPVVPLPPRAPSARKTDPHPGKPDQARGIRTSEQVDAADEELQQQYAEIEESRQSGYAAAAELHVEQDATMEAEKREAVLSIADLPAGMLSRVPRPARVAEDEEEVLSFTQGDFDRQEELDRIEAEGGRVEDDEAYASEDQYAPKGKGQMV
jgi:hypothetical protein